MTTEADLRRAGYPPVRKADETVIIPRAQHEAFWAAAKFVRYAKNWHKQDGRGGFPVHVETILDKVLAALRAAGILEGNGE